MKKKLSAFVVSLTAIVLAVIMASGCSFISTSSKNNYSLSQGDSAAAAQAVTFNTTTQARNIEDAFVEAVAKVERSAVQIQTHYYDIESRKTLYFDGSGVIVDIACENSTEYPAAWKDNDNIIYIVTCHHMISKSGTYGTESVGEIEIRIPDENYSYTNADYIFSGYIGGETSGYAVTLVGGDFESDIALLKLDLNVAAKSGNKLSVDKIVKAQIPDGTYSTRRGETVFSIGNPTGALPGSVARGVVSYLTRSVVVDEIGAMTLMQIDVSTNNGNSGGGLYNLYGELVGITNAGASKALYEGINFAIPCYLSNGNGFVEIVRQLAGTATDSNYGYVSGRKVNFGFSVAEVNGAQYLKVNSVTIGSIAYNRGLRQDDVIDTVKVNGGTAEEVTTKARFDEIIKGLEVGDTLTLVLSKLVYSGGKWKKPEINMTAEVFWFCDTGVYS